MPSLPIARVTRTRAQARASYDRLSAVYDLAGFFEQPYRELLLQRLQPCAGQAVLELGCGTGACLTLLARTAGRVCGLDLSAGMLAVSRRRLARAGLSGRVGLSCGDALRLPYAPQQFDVVCASFVLELLDTPEIPLALAEIQRILRPGGRLGLLCMSKAGGPARLLALYEWLHARFPQVVDCRPIYAAQAAADAGFVLQHAERLSLLGVPLEIVVGVNRSAGRGLSGPGSGQA